MTNQEQCQFDPKIVLNKPLMIHLATSCEEGPRGEVDPLVRNIVLSSITEENVQVIKTSTRRVSLMDPRKPY